MAHTSMASAEVCDMMVKGKKGGARAREEKKGKEL
jgi:hypothetical protein